MKRAPRLHLRLTVEVEYALNGTDPLILKRLLRLIPERAAGDGRLTDALAAEVLVWEAKVEEIP